MEAASEDPLILEYLRVVARRKWVILLSVAVVTGVAFGLALAQSPIYQSEARVLLQPRTAESLFDTGGGLVVSDRNRAVQTEIDIIQSQAVRSLVVKALGFAPSLSVQPVPQRDVLRLVVTNADPDIAASSANVYAAQYIKFKRTQAVDDLLAAGAQIQAKIDELQSQIAVAPAGESRATLVGQQGLFRQKLDQLQVDAALKTGGSQLLQSAEPDRAPVAPRPVRRGLQGLVGGLVLGIGAALLLDRLDDGIHDKDDLAELTGLPVLALVPVVGDWKEKGLATLVALNPRGAHTEAYRSLRTAVHYLDLDRPLRSLQVTSPGSGEGKSTTAANLAVAIASAGQNVVLVDCDLRRPRIHSYFGLAAQPGFTEVVVGDVDLAEAVHRIHGVENIGVVTSGERPPNPSELLSSTLAAKVLFDLRADDAVVIIDSPPVLPVTDARVLAGMVDATLLVVNRRSTSRGDVTRAIELLEQVDVRLVGTVLNEALPEPGYGYYYGYGAQDAEPHRRRFPSARLRRASRVQR